MLAEDKELTRKLAEGGMVVTEPSAADLAEAEKRIAPYWKEWGERRPAASEFTSAVTTCAWPTSCSNRRGRHLTASTL